MNVGRDSRGVIERAAANEPHLGASVLAEDPTWQVGQRKILCVLPSSRGTSTVCGSPSSSSTRSVSISRLMTKALPVCRWQFRQ